MWGGFGRRLNQRGAFMSVRFSLAKAASAVSTWGLKHVAHRPAANLPGKIALKIDPSLLDELRSKCKIGRAHV